MSMLSKLGNNVTKEEALEALAELRADLAITHAFSGFEIDPEYALSLLKSKDDENLTQLDKDKRDRLIAAVDNLIEFATCEEYQLYKDVISHDPDFDFDTDYFDTDNEELVEEYEALCEKYNKVYAAVENDDIEYAMLIALRWIQYASSIQLTYWTQNDDRVRPWHYALQGFTANKEEFPSWMIPPIEWGCRCFLLTSDGGLFASSEAKKVSAKTPQKPKEIDGVFSESVATCGRIFSHAHRYFEVDKADKPMLDRIVSNIRMKYYGES